MIVLWILLGLFLLLLLLLCLPVRAVLEFGEQLTLDLQYLWLKFRIYPSQMKKAEKDVEKTAEKDAKKTMKKDEKQTGSRFEGLMELIHTVLRLVQSATGGLKFLFRHLVVRDLKLYIRVAEGDPAQTGIQYGRINAYLHSAYAVLRQAFRFKHPSIRLDPDFMRDEYLVQFHCKLSLLPIFAVGAALRIGVEFLYRTVRAQMEERQALWQVQTAHTDR